MFNVFVKLIPNFYSCKANVEFTIVCFDRIDVKRGFTSNGKNETFAICRQVFVQQSDNISYLLRMIKGVFCSILV